MVVNKKNTLHVYIDMKNYTKILIEEKIYLLSQA